MNGLGRSNSAVYNTPMPDLHQLATDLAARGLTVAVGESPTGGLLSYLLSSPPGASRYFLGGVTAYSNEAKMEQLGVPEAAFAGGAVSEAVAAAMAEGARLAMHADVGLSNTGIAGPGGATETKPVGLFYVGIATAGGHRAVTTHRFAGDRDQTRRAAAEATLDLLRDYLNATTSA